MIILGIDPGTVKTGYALLESDPIKLLDYGVIIPPPKALISEKYKIIYESVSHLIDLHKPDYLAVETQYVHKNIQSAIKLGMARGVIVLAAAQKGVKISEFAPSMTKKALSGKGHASKWQIQKMAQVLLNMQEL